MLRENYSKLVLTTKRRIDKLTNWQTDELTDSRDQFMQAGMLYVYTHSMETIYISRRAQVAVGTFFMKSSVPHIFEKIGHSPMEKGRNKISIIFLQPGRISVQNGNVLILLHKLKLRIFKTIPSWEKIHSKRTCFSCCGTWLTATMWSWGSSACSPSWSSTTSWRKPWRYSKGGRQKKSSTL